MKWKQTNWSWRWTSLKGKQVQINWCRTRSDLSKVDLSTVSPRPHSEKSNLSEKHKTRPRLSLSGFCSLSPLPTVWWAVGRGLGPGPGPWCGSGLDGWLGRWQRIWVCLPRSGWTVCSLGANASLLFSDWMGRWLGGTLNVSPRWHYGSSFASAKWMSGEVKGSFCCLSSSRL